MFTSTDTDRIVFYSISWLYITRHYTNYICIFLALCSDFAYCSQGNSINLIIDSLIIISGRDEYAMWVHLISTNRHCVTMTISWLFQTGALLQTGFSKRIPIRAFTVACRLLGLRKLGLDLGLMMKGWSCPGVNVDVLFCTFPSISALASLGLPAGWGSALEKPWDSQVNTPLWVL